MPYFQDGTVKLTRASATEGRMIEMSGGCYRGPHGEQSCPQHSKMGRSRPVATHAKQRLDDAVNIQTSPGVPG